MQASVVRARTGCRAEALKEWTREGVIVPVSQTPGSGNHAVYDDANLIAVALAMQLKDLGVVLSRLADSFKILQSTLRSRSSLEWRGARVVMSRNAVLFVDGIALSEIPTVALVFDLDRLATTLVPLDSDPQLSLKFGVVSVS